MDNYLMIGVALLLVIAGCSGEQTGPAGPNTTNTATHGGLSEGVSVRFAGPTLNRSANVNYSNSTFRMEGQILVGNGLPEVDQYESVHVVLYSANGTRMAAKRIGPISAYGGQANVSWTVTVPERPKYVVPESPDFWRKKTEVGITPLKYHEREGLSDVYGPNDLRDFPGPHPSERPPLNETPIYVK